MIGFEPGLHLHHDERLGGELELAGERDPKAWSAPRTWVAGEVLTASLMNVHLRDQLLWLGAIDSRLSSPPTPIDGMLWRYVADATGGIEWLLAYNSSDATANKWHALGARGLFAEVAASETTASTTYVGLSTTGPSITLARGGDYDVQVGARLESNGSGAINRMSFDIGGTGAVDTDALEPHQGSGSGDIGVQGSRLRRKTTIAAATTLTAKYKTSAGTLIAVDRWMLATPNRIG